MSLHAELKQSFLAWMGRVESAAAPLGLDAVGASMREDLEASLADPRIRIVVCGEWSTGKSTLVNALVGVADLLPSDVGPCTSYVTVVEGGPQEKYAVQRDGAASTIRREDFLALTAAKEGDPSIERILVTRPVAWPNDQFVVIDTPGLEDITKTRSDVTLSFLPQADVIVLVMSAVTGVKDSVVSFVRDQLSARELRRVILVLNQKDHLNTDEDVARRIAACKAQLEGDLPNAPWIATNARDASLGADSGIPALREAVSAVVRRERLAILAQRFARSAQGRLDDLASRLAAEESSLGLTTAEAEQRLSDFRRKVAETARANDDAFRRSRALITGEIEAWLKGVPGRVQEVQRTALERIQALDDLEALRSYINTEELSRALAAELRVMGTDLESMVGAAIARAGKEILSEQLVCPTVPAVDVAGAIPPVDSIFRHVPALVVKVLEVVLADVLLPGGILTALLARLGLGSILKHLKGLSFLKQFFPTELIRQQLQSAVGESLAAFPDRVIPAFRAAATEAANQALEEIRSSLERRAVAVESGLEDARAKLAEDRSRVEARRQQLGIARRALERLGTELPTLHA